MELGEMAFVALIALQCVNFVFNISSAVICKLKALTTILRSTQNGCTLSF